MKRIWGSVCTATTVLAGCVLLMPACNHPDASLFIQGIVAPPTPTSGGGCTYSTPSSTETLLFSGSVDVAVATSYTEVVLLGNQILPQADPNSDKAETSSITLDKVTVHVTDSLDNTLGDYTTQVSGFIPVGAAGTPGYGYLSAELIGGTAMEKLTAQAKATPYKQFTAITSFYFTGKTLGDVTVTSDTFSYDVAVCYGCLVNFTGFTVAGHPDQCDYGSTTAPTVSCNQGEDAAYDCITCSDPICQFAGSGGVVADAGP
jgi:hypothetical protein